MKKRLFYILLTCGALLFGSVTNINPAQASNAGLTIVANSDTTAVFNSGHQPTPIHSEPTLTKRTGLALQTEIGTWPIIRVAKSGRVIKALDLGNNQWVDPAYSRKVVMGSGDYLEVLTAGAYNPIYRDCLGVNRAGSLDTDHYHEWRINKIAYDGNTGAIAGVDLGNNQWLLAKTKGQYLIPKILYFQAGTPMFTRTNQAKGQLSATLPYKVFGATIVGYRGVSVKLGTENQWVVYQMGSTSPF